MYVPSTPPTDVGALSQWLAQETHRIRAALVSPAPGVQFDELHAEPSKPRTGLTAYADGVDWNPGAGAGLYVYKAGAWVLLG